MTFIRMPRPVFFCKCGDHAWTTLTKGYVTLVSPDDVRFLRERAWTTLDHPRRKVIYARSASRRLHRVIMGAPDDIQVDHRNGNGIDNRRSNLRAATNQQNSHNGSSHRDGTSRYKGVCWVTKGKKWLAQIRVSRRNISIGYFDKEADAAKAYDAAALKYFGHFARLNFPQQRAALNRDEGALAEDSLLSAKPLSSSESAVNG